MTRKTQNRFSPEVRQRAVRMVLDHGGDHASQWAAMSSIAGKIGCTAETLRKWVRQAERDAGQRPGAASEERERIKEFWLGLGEDERRNLVKVEKEAVLKKMKEQQKHSCNCAVCGRKRSVAVFFAHRPSCDTVR